MKKSFLLLAFLLASLTAFSLDPVGSTVPFEMKAQLRPEALSGRELIAFPGASFVKVHLKELSLGEGESLSVSDGDNVVEVIRGPRSGEAWLSSVQTGTAYLELARAGGSGTPSFAVDEVGVGFVSLPEPESICGVDDRKNAVCYDAEKQTAGLAVGRMLFSSGGSWYLCTGSLVSSSGHFLTNNHCIDDQYGATSLEVWWKYQSSTCSSSQASAEYVTNGSEFITTNASLDYTLLRIADPQLETRYGHLKIANRPAQTGEPIWIPQHGGGTIKKFAVESDMEGGSQAKVVDNDIAGWIAHSDIGYWADTEGGSSGSPVLDSNNKILALHHFGLPSGYSCDSYYMNQGVKMSLIYPEIASYLGAVIPPVVSSIKKATDPFRLIIQGSNFKEGMTALISTDTSPWPYYSYKSETKFVLKGNKSLKDRFPKGTPVTITLVNPDGGTATATYTR